MFHHLIFILVSLFVSATVWSAKDPHFTGKSVDEIYFNLGLHTEFYNAIQKDDSGGLRKFDTAPTLGAGVGIDLSKRWTFLPEINWVLPQTKEGSKIVINTLMYRGDFGWKPFDWIRLRIGTGLIYLHQHGRGGSAKMDNGNGKSTFYYPDENRYSLNNTLDTGVEFLFNDMSLRLQTYTYSIFLEERRQTSYTLFLTYYWKN